MSHCDFFYLTFLDRDCFLMVLCVFNFFFFKVEYKFKGKNIAPDSVHGPGP